MPCPCRPNVTTTVAENPAHPHPTTRKNQSKHIYISYLTSWYNDDPFCVEFKIIAFFDVSYLNQVGLARWDCLFIKWIKVWTNFLDLFIRSAEFDLTHENVSNIAWIIIIVDFDMNMCMHVSWSACVCMCSYYNTNINSILNCLRFNLFYLINS